MPYRNILEINYELQCIADCFIPLWNQDQYLLCGGTYQQEMQYLGMSGFHTGTDQWTVAQDSIFQQPVATIKPMI